jgi:hypothetical protein
MKPTPVTVKSPLVTWEEISEEGRKGDKVRSLLEHRGKKRENGGRLTNPFILVFLATRIDPA